LVASDIECDGEVADFAVVVEVFAVVAEEFEEHADEAVGHVGGFAGDG